MLEIERQQRNVPNSRVSIRATNCEETTAIINFANHISRVVHSGWKRQRNSERNPTLRNREYQLWTISAPPCIFREQPRNFLVAKDLPGISAVNFNSVIFYASCRNNTTCCIDCSKADDTTLSFRQRSLLTRFPRAVYSLFTDDFALTINNGA